MGGTSQQAVIDAYLGVNQYVDWQELETQKRAQDERYARSERLMGNYIKEVGDRIWEDQIVLDKIATEYREGMALVSAGKKISASQESYLFDLYTLAIEVVDSENEILEILIGCNIHYWMTIIPFPILEAKAQKLARRVKELTKMLEAAQKDQTEATAQLVINVAITAGTLAMPHLGLLTKVGITIGQYVLDEMIGGEKSSSVVSAASAPASGIGLTFDAIEKITVIEGTTAQTLSKGLGGAVQVGGLFFDVDEVITTGRNAGVIRAKMIETRMAYESLKKELLKQLQNVAMLKLALVIAELRVRDAKKNAAIARAALEAAMTTNRYPKYSPLRW
ncbi:MAG: hypothetical protein JNL98_27780 [Bryobacterales bacterium]|nr:hypothetical protein [Bryobacterales bacterium]